MPTQAELVERLRDLIAGDFGDNAPSILDLLDYMACAGMKLVPDTGEMAASREYVTLLRGHLPS